MLLTFTEEELAKYILERVNKTHSDAMTIFQTALHAIAADPDILDHMLYFTQVGGDIQEYIDHYYQSGRTWCD